MGGKTQGQVTTIGRRARIAVRRRSNGLSSPRSSRRGPTCKVDDVVRWRRPTSSASPRIGVDYHYTMSARAGVRVPPGSLPVIDRVDDGPQEIEIFYPAACGTHSIRRTKPSLIYRLTKNLRAAQLLLGHTKLESRPTSWHRGGGRLEVGGANRGLTLPRLSRIDRKRRVSSGSRRPGRQVREAFGRWRSKPFATRIAAKPCRNGSSLATLSQQARAALRR